MRSTAYYLWVSHIVLLVMLTIGLLLDCLRSNRELAVKQDEREFGSG